MTAYNKVNEVFKKTSNSIGLYGVNLSPYDFPFANEISSAIDDLDKETVNQICISYDSYNDIISEGPQTNESIGELNKRHLRDFLSKWGLSVDKRVFDDITDDYLVEIYSHKHQQLFRSVNFFFLSQYSLPELTFSPWDELFKRNINNDDIMFDRIDGVLDRAIPYMVPNIPHHILEEIKTGRKFKYEMKKLACVFDELIEGPVGYLTIISVKELFSSLRVIH